MKKSLIALIAFSLCGTLMASTGELERLDKRTVKNMTATEMEQRSADLNDRLTVIQSMDFESLERTERKTLKKELRYINREMSALANGGIYLSTGALLIIILLILIL